MTEEQKKPKTIEERIAIMEEEQNLIRNNIDAMYREFVSSYKVLQQLLGIALVRDPKGERVNLKILSPKKGQGSRGLLADLYFKMQTLWKNQDGKRIVMPH